jgi:soluble lytic murein transglycosylase-like protein
MRVPNPPALAAQAPVVAAQLPWNAKTSAVVEKISLANTHALIRAAAARHRVPAALVRSITAAESGFNPNAVSNKGAIGLMQLMPTTAAQLGADPHVPAQNIEAGTQYLRFLMDKYQHYRDWMKRVIAAYNAGPAAVDRYHGVPPFPETRTYVSRVLALFHTYQRGRW